MTQIRGVPAWLCEICRQDYWCTMRITNQGALRKMCFPCWCVTHDAKHPEQTLPVFVNPVRETPYGL